MFIANLSIMNVMLRIPLIASNCFIKLFPATPLSGTYTTPQGKSYNSAFLGLQKMETEKRLNNGEADDSIFWCCNFLCCNPCSSVIVNTFSTAIFV